MTAIHFKSSLRRVRTDDGQIVLTPKNTENHTNEHAVDLRTDPSVEMRSQIGPRTAHETCAERPNLHRGNRREKVRCASFCTVSKLCSNCD